MSCFFLIPILTGAYLHEKTKPYLTSNRCLIEVQLSTYLFKTSILQRFSL